MNITRVYAIFLRQIYLIRDTSSRFFQVFVWVTVDIMLWGFVSKYVNEASGSGFNFIPAFVGAILLWDFNIQVMQGITMSFFEDVWARNFLNIFASPLRISEYVAGLVLSSIARGAIALIFMIFLATAFFGFSALIYGASLAFFVLVLFIFGIALGIAGVAVVLRWGPSAEWFVWPISAILSPFVGVIYPISVLPAWMQAISRFLAPTYVFEGVRAIVAGGTFPLSSFFAALGLAILSMMLMYWVFWRVYLKAIRTGLIARYSAETAN